MACLSLVPPLFDSQLSFGSQQAGRKIVKIIKIPSGQLVLWHPPMFSPPFYFLPGMLCLWHVTCRFLLQEKRRLFIARYRGGEFLEGCLFHDKWNSLAMPATIGLREPGSLKIRVCWLQLSSLSSLVLWHFSLHTFIPQTKVTKSVDSWCRPPQRPFVRPRWHVSWKMS